MKLSEFFERYPVTITGFAKVIGKDRQWINTRILNSAKVKPQDSQIINEGIKQLSKKLRSIKVR